MADKWLELAELKRGALVQLTNGQVAEFVRLKQSKFIGLIEKKSYDIPVTMFVKVVGQAESIVDPEGYKELKPKDLFYIDQGGKALLFVFVGIERGKIIGINPIDRGRSRIDTELYAGKVVDLERAI